MQGILTSRGVPVYAGGTAVGNKAVQLFKAMNGVRGSAFVEPEWIVMHPTDWEAIRLLTDTAGQYLYGGPGQGPYGNGGVAAGVRAGHRARPTRSGASRSTSRPRSAAPARRSSATARPRRCGPAEA